MDPFFVRNSFVREFSVDIDYDGDITELKAQWQFGFENGTADRIFEKSIYKEVNYILEFEVPDTFFTEARVGDCSNQVVLYNNNTHKPVWYSDIFYNKIRKPVVLPY